MPAARRNADIRDVDQQMIESFNCERHLYLLLVERMT
jgi:hypothetical protein